MKDITRNMSDADATRESTPAEIEKLRRNKKARQKSMPQQNPLPSRNAPGLNEKEDEDQMEDLYREEENRGKAEAE